MNDDLGDGGVNRENESILNLEKDIDMNYDPGLWGSINDTRRVMLVPRGLIKFLKESDAFPIESTRGRHFSSKFYVCDLPNGEKQERKWLVYSNELNKVFCFCCKLFKSKPMTTSLAEEGTSDWHNLPTKLREHERNVEHIANVVRWVDLHNGLQQKATIDKKNGRTNRQRKSSLEDDTSSNHRCC